MDLFLYCRFLKTKSNGFATAKPSVRNFVNKSAYGLRESDNLFFIMTGIMHVRGRSIGISISTARIMGKKKTDITLVMSAKPYINAEKEEGAADLAALDVFAFSVR